MAKTQTGTSLLATGSVSAAGTANSSVLDCTAQDGGLITFAITNGGTGPTLQCEARVMVAHKQGSAPAAGNEGTASTDWKIAYVVGGGTTASAKTRGQFKFGPEVAYAFVQFTGHTAQAITAEASATTFAY